MVSQKTQKRPAIASTRASRKQLSVIKFLVIFGLVFLLALILTAGIVRLKETPDQEIELNGCPTLTGQVLESDECMSNTVGVKKIDFQPTVDSWVNSVGGEKGIIIYDLATHEIAGEYNANEKFATASIYKLFVVYEGYRRLENGQWEADNAAGGTGYTILECLDLAIRESHSPCAETLWSMIGRDNLDNIVQNDFGLPEVTVGGLSATPNEIMKIMRRFYGHSDIKNETLINTMQDSFLNQPVTTYNWRQGLPSGFSDQVEVYNKVGWEWGGRGWKIYDDAAIVRFVTEKRDLIVVVMTNGVDYQEIRELGAQIEQTFYANMY